MSFMAQSLYFGVVISLLTYWFGMWLKKRLGCTMQEYRYRNVLMFRPDRRKE